MVTHLVVAGIVGITCFALAVKAQNFMCISDSEVLPRPSDDGKGNG